MRSFFSFAVARKWIIDNPAAMLKPPVGSDKDIPVIPFMRVQVAALIKECGDNDYLKTFLLTQSS
ncbi:MAG: hypothetical protein ABSF22_09745 [Bryobacteraceae bacterium]